MEICMKDTLRELRHKKNVTQEALANHLGITPQSVGKWERGEGFPDITLLPKIAFYFDVTVDELLNVTEMRVNETIEQYEAESKKLKKRGEVQQNIELWEKAYSEFPNDCRVMHGLMHAICSKAIHPIPEDDVKRIIALGETILERSSDVSQRESAIQELCYTYESIGDKENALKYADMCGSPYVNRDDLRATVLDGEEGLKACQENIMRYVHLAALSALSTASKGVLSREETIEAHRFSIDIMKFLFSDGNVGFYAFDISYWYYCIAREYAFSGDKERTIETLEECAKYSVADAKNKKSDIRYTAPMVNRLIMDMADESKNFTGNACNATLRRLAWDCFDFVREDERYKRLVSEMEKYAE